MKLPRGKPKVTLNFEDKGGISVLSGHFLSGFGIFGPTRIQPQSFKAKILLL
jgi:hypothetical protein